MHGDVKDGINSRMFATIWHSLSLRSLFNNPVLKHKELQFNLLFDLRTKLGISH
jgi:hypothetical protein